MNISSSETLETFALQYRMLVKNLIRDYTGSLPT